MRMTKKLPEVVIDSFPNKLLPGNKFFPIASEISVLSRATHHNLKDFCVELRNTGSFDFPT
jgi:hypothetical protein